MATPHGAIATDALIVGAGPVGLFQAFQLGLQEIHTEIVDSLPQPGGQCAALYGDKPIYDIPGIPVVSGNELAQRLLEQVEPFRPGLHYGDEVASLEKQADGSFLAGTAAGKRFLAKTVFIAAGVGAFQPRRLKVDGAQALEGKSILYHRPGQDLHGDVVVLGDEDAAFDALFALVQQPLLPRSITLVHRRDAFRADEVAVARMRALHAAGRLQFAIGQPVGLDADAGKLRGLRILDAVGHERTLPADTILALLGLSPKLGPVADWGLALERKQLTVDTATFATSEPGIFAVGDINTYPGKRKLIVCGFHECVLAAFAAAEIVFPGKPIHLQYTTTSTRLHELLGVAKA